MMLYQVETAMRTAGDKHGAVVTLRGPDGSRAEIWTACGFNCLKWSVAEGKEALFAMPDWEANPVPTRSGIPILAPFPNRIRDGKFTWKGHAYQLPLNDSVKANAIHGEAPRHPWRIIETGSDEQSAWVKGAFRPSLDASQALQNWTGDYELTATWLLTNGSLHFSYSCKNLGDIAMPFGLGLHPYFRFPLASVAEPIDAAILEVPAKQLWELNESLPTTKKLAVSGETDFLKARAIAGTNIDHLYTGLTAGFDKGGMRSHGRLTHPNHPGALEVRADKSFGDIVLFTPVHRKAVCIEPYTCPSDAVNLHARGIECGLIEVAPGQTVEGKAEFHWQSAG